MHYALIEKCLKSDKLVKDGISPNFDLCFIPASQKKNLTRRHSGQTLTLFLFLKGLIHLKCIQLKYERLRLKKLQLLKESKTQQTKVFLYQCTGSIHSK